MNPELSRLSRPDVYDYQKPVEFLNALLAYYKASSRFSLRQRTSQVPSCSQALVSQILNGRRQLNRSNLPGIAAVFKLTTREFHFIDGKLSSKAQRFEDPTARPSHKERPTKNHLLSNWLNPYVKDLVDLKGFSLNADTLFSMLKGAVPSSSIAKSVEFLLREGFWRRTPTGEVLAEEAAVVTTNGIPNEKIRHFHRKALKLAIRGITHCPPEKRKSSTVLISIDREHEEELRGLIDSFQNQLLRFIEQHPNGKEALVQVAIHLTPIAEAYR